MRLEKQHHGGRSGNDLIAAEKKVLKVSDLMQVKRLLLLWVGGNAVWVCILWFGIVCVLLQQLMLLATLNVAACLFWGWWCSSEKHVWAATAAIRHRL